MNFTLYQINLNHIDAKKFIFMPMCVVKHVAQQVNYSLYSKAWESEENNLNLDFLFDKYNDDNRPNGKICRSMSVSDIVVINTNNKEETFFCDVFGWVKIANFV